MRRPALLALLVLGLAAGPAAARHAPSGDAYSAFAATLGGRPALVVGFHPS